MLPLSQEKETGLLGKDLDPLPLDRPGKRVTERPLRSVCAFRRCGTGSQNSWIGGVQLLLHTALLY